MKNPLPLIARSVALEEFSRDPWVHWALVPQNSTPRPTLPVAESPPRDVLRMLAKWERLPLKAVVFTLAMLSPMTVMAVAFALRPEIPAYNDAIMA